MTVQAPPQAFVNFFWPELQEFLGRVNRTPGNVWFTSWWRSWDENLAAGGSTNPLSQHLAGLAVDVVARPPSTPRGIVQAARASGLVAVDEGDHIHIQLWPRGGLDRRLGL